MSRFSSSRVNNVTDVLVKENVITAYDVSSIVNGARRQGISESDYVVEHGIVASRKELLKHVANVMKVDYIDLTETSPHASASKILAYETAQHYKVIPLWVKDNSLYVTTTPERVNDIMIGDMLRRNTKYASIKFCLSPEDEIERALNDMYRLDDELRELSQQVENDSRKSGDKVSSLNDSETIVEESGAEKFVRVAIAQAIVDRASDIVFESHENYLMLRYRVDGVFHEKQRAPRAMSDEIISVIKIQADLDISVRQRAQDGRLRVNHNGVVIDLRVNIFPIQDGENVTMRILDNSQANMDLEKLGFSEANLERFRNAIQKPQGVILVTGPTGSGKSVTLYAGLREIANPDVNVMTIEDPIEYRVPHVKQSQLNIKQGWTYPEAIRAFMRAAPNIILVGEIRDYDTGHIALEAGMTGHLVMSTLHTNSSSEAPARLIDLGIDPHIITSTLTAVVAQRLVRRLCEKCKEPYTPTADELLAVQFPWNEGEELPTLYKPKKGGCKECSHIGFRGRIACHEVLVMNDKIRRLVSQKVESFVVEQTALDDGMKKMIEDGWEKVLSGTTTIPEVLKSII